MSDEKQDFIKEFYSIQNNGTDNQEYHYNQCMLISILDHLRYVRRSHIGFNINMFRIQQNININNWINNDIFNVTNSNQIQIIQNIMNNFRLNIYIRYMNIRNGETFLGLRQTIPGVRYNNEYENIDIIAYGNHFELLVPYNLVASMQNNIKIKLNAYKLINIPLFKKTNNKTIIGVKDNQELQKELRRQLLSTINNHKEAVNNVNQNKTQLEKVNLSDDEFKKACDEYAKATQDEAFYRDQYEQLDIIFRETLANSEENQLTDSNRTKLKELENNKQNLQISITNNNQRISDLTTQQQTEKDADMKTIIDYELVNFNLQNEEYKAIISTIDKDIKALNISPTKQKYLKYEQKYLKYKQKYFQLKSKLKKNL